MKICTVIGARPQFIKAAMVSRALQKHDSFTEVIIHTGQHYDENMSSVFFKEMLIPEPKYNLGIQSLLHGKMTGMMMEGIEQVILKEKPDAVLVFGDTNSTLAGALTAAKLHVKLIHVEAGIRSFNMYMAEEVNRILTDRVSNLLCCPTANAMQNLRNEGFENFDCTFLNTGDVMQDAVLHYSKIAATKSTIIKDLQLGSYILCTLHRAENTNDPQRLSGIIDALNEINSETPIILPLHPRTKKTIEALGLKVHFRVIEPQGYFNMLQLLRNCKLVITDSGGLQKESYFVMKPCVTLRDETEWPELVNIGYNKLAGAGKEKILSSVNEMMDVRLNGSHDMYGDGNAAGKIVDAIKSYL
jgi:UDP-GlcNAc3NAcA epimerase